MAFPEIGAHSTELLNRVASPPLPPPSRSAAPQFSLEILKVIKTSQAQNGLRHSDYQRYRQYCARRLHRLRRSVNFKHGKKRFVKKTITAEVVTDTRFLMMHLVNAERAWSYAMQLKDESVDLPRKKQHMVSRLAKAARWAYELQKLCIEVADERTQLEAQAYSSFMLGSLLLEKSRWKQAEDRFSKAQNYYSDLSRLESDEELKAMFNNMADELTPSIRYCKYNAKKSGGGDDGDGDDAALKDLLDGSLDTLNTPALDMLKSKLKDTEDKSRAAEAKTLTKVSWRGASLPLQNAKLRISIITARNELKEVAAETGLDKKMDRFGKALVAYEDGLTVIGRDLTDLRGEDGRASEKAELEQLEVYLEYLKVQANLDRNLVLADSYRKRLAIAGIRQEPVNCCKLNKRKFPDIAGIDTLKKNSRR